jgi:hypothetical protein
VRTRVSFAFTGVLVIALMAVVGFAAFSAQQTDATPAPEAPLEEFLPQSVSGRILGAVVAAALTPEPDIEPEFESADAYPEERTTPPAPEEAPVAAAVAATSTTTTTTTTKAPDRNPSTANVKPPDTTAPEITISSPKDGATVDERVIEFSGSTEAGATVTSGTYGANMSEDGDWSIKLVLREGRNRAYFTSTDAAGNSETISVTVNYDPPSTTTSSTTTSTTTSTTVPPPDTGGRRNVEQWRWLVEQYFPPELVDEALAVMKCESKGDPAAYNSRSGASGLFQFIPNTWSWASSKAGWAGATAFDPEANTASAAWLVQWSINRGKDTWAHWSCKP